MDMWTLQRRVSPVAGVFLSAKETAGKPLGASIAIVPGRNTRPVRHDGARNLVISRPGPTASLPHDPL